MSIIKQLQKITAQILFVIVFIFFSTLEAKNLDKFNKGENLSDYFSGILLLNQSKYKDSYEYLKRLDGLEISHPTYSSKYLYSLVNSGKFNQAYNYSKKLDKDQRDSFESDLIIGTFLIKNSKPNLAEKFFLKAKKRNSRTVLDNYVVNSLLVWTNVKNEKYENAINNLNQLDKRFENLKKIQKIFLNCYFNNEKTELLFNELISNQRTDFSRYNYFYANYLDSIGLKEKAFNVVERSLKKYPRNLLLNQYKLDLANLKNNFYFDCKKEQHVIAEIFYITANALSSQSIYQLSNFYLNLAKYLNKEFHAFDTLMAENFYNINDFSNSKKTYQKLINYGDAFKWFANKQISRILIKQERKDKSLKLLKKSYNDLAVKGLYETFDYAEFLKNNERFEESIKYYTIILNKIDKKHPLYPEVTDGRGVAYERIDEWKKAEKDLLNSLEVSPDQAYVINYLAYTWIEKGIKIKEALEMLKKANKLKSNDPYIIDSLGWALFKMKRYKESKDYLQQAVKLMPADPIVNDHYGDVLWKNGKEIQARYYWNYVMSIEDAEKDLKEKVEKKLTKGL